MATFSVNQVRQLYVATAAKEAPVLASDAKGTIAVKADTAKTHLYFQYKGADNLMRSDLIDVKNILSAKATDGATLAYKLKKVTIKLDGTVNAGVPVSGQDYILRIAFQQYVGMSDEDQYFKYGMVHAYRGMTASDFYKTLALSLVKNFSREPGAIFKFELTTSSDAVEVTLLTKASELTGTYTGVVIKELPQPWRLGVFQQTPVYFKVQSSPITVDGEDVTWVTIEEATEGTINNGKNTADLEYFCMGERGDMYRGIAWPHNIVTEYLVDPSKEYHYFNVHYAYVGGNEGVQKSEKDITIVCSDKAELNKVIAAFNTATSLNVATL